METSFKTPIHLLESGLTSDFLEALVKDIYAIKAAEPSIEISNLHGWHSDTNLFGRNEPNVKLLCRALIKETITKLTSISDSFEPDKYDGEFGGWINVNPRGGANAAHHHQGWDWSGVFYLKQPKVEDGRSGMIEFINPCQQSSPLASKGFLNVGFEPFFRVRPNEGQIVIFPSYLVHSVYPNESDDDRISIAYNVRLNRKHR